MKKIKVGLPILKEPNLDVLNGLNIAKLSPKSASAGLRWSLISILPYPTQGKYQNGQIQPALKKTKLINLLSRPYIFKPCIALH